LKKTGEWKPKRGVDKDYYNKIISELTCGGPVTKDTVEPANVTSAPPPPPPPPPQPVAPVTSMDFPEFMKRRQASNLTDEQVNAVLKKYDIESLVFLASHQDRKQLIPTIAQELGV
jgi:hypothetical protein